MTQDIKTSADMRICNTPEQTFRFGEEIGKSLVGGETILLYGTLGAGKTLLTKGIACGLEYDIDEVTSPSFTLVNLYKAKFDVYHIDLWRVGVAGDPVFAVGLEEILENESAVVVIEWAEHLPDFDFPRKTIRIGIKGEGDGLREVSLLE